MKVPTSTSFEASDFERIQRLAEVDQSNTAHVIRKATLRGLLKLEAEVLGEEFVGGVKRAKVKREVPA
jgi:hypothetical protein